jgi:hypothetical protein
MEGKRPRTEASPQEAPTTSPLKQVPSAKRARQEGRDENSGSIDVLPPEALSHIFLQLDSVHSLMAASLVCRRWKAVVDSEPVWRALFNRLFSDKQPMDLSELFMQDDEEADGPCLEQMWMWPCGTLLLLPSGVQAPKSCPLCLSHSHVNNTSLTSRSYDWPEWKTICLERLVAEDMEKIVHRIGIPYGGATELLMYPFYVRRVLRLPNKKKAEEGEDDGDEDNKNESSISVTDLVEVANPSSLEPGKKANEVFKSTVGLALDKEYSFEDGVNHYFEQLEVAWADWDENSVDLFAYRWLRRKYFEDGIPPNREKKENNEEEEKKKKKNRNKGNNEETEELMRKRKAGAEAKGTMSRYFVDAGTMEAEGPREDHGRMYWVYGLTRNGSLVGLHGAQFF